MIVTPIKGLYGRPVANHDGILLMFERQSPMPAIGTPIEVMICFAAPPRYVDGWQAMSPAKQARNPPRIPFLVVREVTDEDALVEISGFKVSAFFSPRPRAFVSEEARDHLRARFGYGPGWLGAARSPVIVHDDAGALDPTHAYVAGADLRDGLNRITGLPSLDHVDPAIIDRLTRRRLRETIPPRRTVDTLTSRRGQRSA